MLIHRRTITTRLCIAALLLAASALPAHAAKKSGEKKAQQSNIVRVKPTQNHSGETSAERDKRLFRECRGLPNAGACAGYTRR